MRLISTDAIIRMARVWTDTTGSQNPTDANCLDFLNEIFPTFYDDLCDASESDWFFKQYTFTTQSGVASYALPSDMHRLKFADSLVMASPPTPSQRWTRLKRMDEALLNMPGAFFGQSIPGGQSIRLSYNPQAPVLAQYAFLTLPTSDGVDSITFTAAAAGLPGTAVKIAIALGGATGVTVSGMTITVTISPTATSGAVQTAFNAVAAATALASVSVTNSGLDTMVQAAQSATPLGGTVQFDYVNGWERFLVASLASMIMRRLNLDNGQYESEKQAVGAKIRSWATKRDSGEPQVCKDVMAERWMSYGPMLAVFPNRFGYRIFGQDPQVPGTGSFQLYPTVAA